MWSYSLLKRNARRSMAGCYPSLLLIALLSCLLGGRLTVQIPGIIYSLVDFFYYAPTPYPYEGFPVAEYYYSIIYELTMLLLLCVAIMVLAFRVLVSNPIRVGLAAYLSQNRRSYPSVRVLFSAFGPSYLNIVRVMLLRDLKIILWGLLLIFPGIYKSYQYWQVPFLLADDPTLTPRQAFRLSSQAMEREKFRLFLLQLSFAGWILLACAVGYAVTFGYWPGIALLFVEPYLLTTYAELYAAQRARLIQQGILKQQEPAPAAAESEADPAPASVFVPTETPPVKDTVGAAPSEDTAAPAEPVTQEEAPAPSPFDPTQQP